MKTKKNEEMKAQEAEETKAEETKLEVQLQEDDSLTEAEPKKARNIPAEQKKLNELMRNLRHRAWRYVRFIAGTEIAEKQMMKLEELFKNLILEIDKMNDESFIFNRFSMMSENEKNILRELLNK